MTDTPNTAPTGAPIPDAQAGASAIQLDQSQLPDSMRSQSFMDQDTSHLGPEAAPDSSDQSQQQQTQIPPVTQNGNVQTDRPQMETEQTPGKQMIPEQAQPNIPAAQQHPAVKRAGLLYNIAETLAGGPRYQTSIDANTGIVTRTKVPLSGRQLGMAIALEAFSGAIAGGAQHGPNHVEAAAAAGYKQGQQQQQQIQEQQDTEESQAKSDFALKAQTTQTNFQMYHNAWLQGQMEKKANQQYVDTFAPIIDIARKQGGIKEEGIEGSSVQELAKKYHVSEDLFVPQAVTPRLDPTTGKQATDPRTGALQWNLKYALLDPSVAGKIDPAVAQKWVDRRIPGSFTLDSDGKPQPIKFPDNVQMRIGTQASLTAKSAAIDTAEAAIGGQFQNFKDGDKMTSELHKNLEDAYVNGVNQTALQTASRLAGVPVDQWQKTMQTMKVDPGIQGQVMSILPNGAIDAAKAQAAKEKTDAAVATDTAKRNANPTSVEQAESVVASPTATPEQKAAAQKIISLDKQTKYSEAFSNAKNSEIGRVEGRVAEGLPKEAGKGDASQTDDNLTHPELAKYVQDANNYKTPNGTNEAFLNAMMQTDPERAKMIQALDKGFDLQSYYAAAKKFGGSINADLHAYDPSWNVNDVHKYEETMKQLAPTGKLGATYAHASTTLEHLLDASNQVGSASFYLGKGGYSESIHRSDKEMDEMYANGYKSGETDAKETQKNSDTRIPYIAHQTLSKRATLAMDKIEEMNRVTQEELPRGTHVPPPLSIKAAVSYNALTGKTADSSLINKHGAGQHVTPEIARWFLQQNGNDKAKARADAQANNWRF